jgi:hypothetical protein
VSPAQPRASSSDQRDDEAASAARTTRSRSTPLAKKGEKQFVLPLMPVTSRQTLLSMPLLVSSACAHVSTVNASWMQRRMH